MKLYSNVMGRQKPMNIARPVPLVLVLLISGCMLSKPGGRLEVIEDLSCSEIERTHIAYDFKNNSSNWPIGSGIATVFRSNGIGDQAESPYGGYLLTVDIDSRDVGGVIGVAAYFVTSWVTIASLGIIPSYSGEFYTIKATLSKGEVPLLEKEYKERVHSFFCMAGDSIGPESPKWPDNARRAVGGKIGLHILRDVEERLRQREPAN